MASIQKEELPEISAIARSFTPGIYRHFKGGLYEALVVARNSEAPSEEFVIYRALDGGAVWARLITMFFDSISTSAYTGPRFAKAEGA